MRKEFEMTEEQFKNLLQACRPTPVMFSSGGRPMFDSPQENANRAWESLGKEMGFEPYSVQATSKGDRFFTAEARAKVTL